MALYTVMLFHRLLNLFLDTEQDMMSTRAENRNRRNGYELIDVLLFLLFSGRLYLHSSYWYRLVLWYFLVILNSLSFPVHIRLFVTGLFLSLCYFCETWQASIEVELKIKSLNLRATHSRFLIKCLIANCNCFSIIKRPFYLFSLDKMILW